MTDDKFKPLEDASVARDKAVRALILEEIRERIPAAIHREEQAAAALRDASEALEQPTAALAGLEKEIYLVQGKCSDLAENSYSADIGTRIDAKEEFRKWDQELRELERQADELSQQVEQLRQAKNKAADALENATLERLALEENCTEELAYFGEGKRTDAYRTFRFGWNDLVIMLRPGNEGHSEWPEAVRWLEVIAHWAGFRLVRDTKDDQWRRTWQQIYDDANPPQPAPSGQEVMRADFAALEREIIREQDIRWNRPAR